MWFKSSFSIPAVVAISFCFIGGTTPAVADILHVPGIYFENIDLHSDAISISSSDGPDVTTIDGGGSGTVVSCIRGEGTKGMRNKVIARMACLVS